MNRHVNPRVTPTSGEEDMAVLTCNALLNFQVLAVNKLAGQELIILAMEGKVYHSTIHGNFPAFPLEKTNVAS